MIREQVSDSSMQSALSSESPSESAATQQLNSDFSSLGDADDIQHEHYDTMDDYFRDADEKEQEKTQRMAERGKAGMVDRIDAVTKLSEAFQASQATGFEPFVGTTGDKFKDTHIRDGQDLDLLRVVEGKNPPPYISELSKNKEAVESFRASHGLFDPQSQAAASSSSRSTKGTKDETNDPETSVAKARGRPVDPNSARQKAMAKK
jgi:hypothetical protein